MLLISAIVNLGHEIALLFTGSLIEETNLFLDFLKRNLIFYRFSLAITVHHQLANAKCEIMLASSMCDLHL